MCLLCHINLKLCTQEKHFKFPTECQDFVPLPMHNSIVFYYNNLSHFVPYLKLIHLIFSKVVYPPPQRLIKVGCLWDKMLWENHKTKLINLQNITMWPSPITNNVCQIFISGQK